MIKYLILKQISDNVIHEAFNQSNRVTANSFISEIKNHKGFSQLYVLVENILNQSYTDKSVAAKVLDESILMAKTIAPLMEDYNKLINKAVKTHTLSEAHEKLNMVLFEEVKPWNITKYSKNYHDILNIMVEEVKEIEKPTINVTVLEESINKLPDSSKQIITSILSAETLEAPINEYKKLFVGDVNKLIGENKDGGDFEYVVKLYELRDRVSGTNLSEMEDSEKINSIVKFEELRELLIK